MPGQARCQDKRCQAQLDTNRPKKIKWILEYQETAIKKVLANKCLRLRLPASNCSRRQIEDLLCNKSNISGDMLDCASWTNNRFSSQGKSQLEMVSVNRFEVDVWMTNPTGSTNYKALNALLNLFHLVESQFQHSFRSLKPRSVRIVSTEVQFVSTR